MQFFVEALFDVQLSYISMESSSWVALLWHKFEVQGFVYMSGERNITCITLFPFRDVQISQISIWVVENRSIIDFTMYKVKRLAIRLGRLALPTCFTIECQIESEAQVLFEAKTWLESDAKNRA